MIVCHIDLVLLFCCFDCPPGYSLLFFGYWVYRFIRALREISQGFEMERFYRFVVPVADVGISHSTVIIYYMIKGKSLELT